MSSQPITHRLRRVRYHLLVAVLVTCGALPASAHAGVDPDHLVGSGDGRAFFLGASNRAPALFLTDGTSLGTTVVRTFCSAANCLRPTEIVEFGGVPLLFANDEVKVRAYRIDTSGQLTAQLEAANDERLPWVFRVVDGVLFELRVNGDGTFSLVRYDAGFRAQVVAGPLATAPTVLAVRGDGSTFISMFRDYTRAKLEMIQPTGARTALGTMSIGSQHAPRFTGSRMYFVGIDEAHGTEPWVTDGTPAGTRLLADLVGGPQSAPEIESGPVLRDAWYVVERPQHVMGSGKVHRLSGSGAVPEDVVLPTSSEVHPAGAILALRDGVEVHLQSGTTWFPPAADGSAAVPLLEAPQRRGGSPTGLLDGTAYWISEDSNGPMRLIRTDGTPAGTRAVAEIPPGSSFKTDSEPSATWFASAGGLLYFDATAPGSNERELWRTDGTAAGTQLVTKPGQFGVTSRTIAAPSGTVVRRGQRVVVTVRGRVTLPPDTVRPWASCIGSVVVTIRRGGRGPTQPAVPLRWRNGACGYTASATFRAGKSRQPVHATVKDLDGRSRMPIRIDLGRR